MEIKMNKSTDIESKSLMGAHIPPGSATRGFIGKNWCNFNYGPRFCSPIIHKHYFDQPGFLDEGCDGASDGKRGVLGAQPPRKKLTFKQLQSVYSSLSLCRVAGCYAL